MQITDVHNMRLGLPEVATFTVDQMPNNDDEWAEQIAELDLTKILGSYAVDGPTLAPHPIHYPMIRRPKDGLSRDWWAGDHLLHVDGTRWEAQPVLTLIGCKQADEGAPTTDLVDTVRLLEITHEDGFWANYGLNESDLAELASVFLDSTYYSEAQPYLRAFMTPEEQARLDEINQVDIEKANEKTEGTEITTLDGLIVASNEKCPPKLFRTIQKTPFSNLDSLFLDAGGRNPMLLGPSGEDYTKMLHALRLKYLTGDAPEELGILKPVQWAANLCLVFPQIGTLHRANPGNEHNRELYLGFLSQIDL